jgi:DNA-3-methyladenine glycosylase I
MAKNSNSKKRCTWPGADELMLDYHDKEWGVPLRNDQKLFEFMVLDAFQAGLSWRIVLHKRENFRRAFDDFNPEIISKYKEAKIQKLLKDEGIIRNQLKIRGTVASAQAFLKVQKEFGSFGKYIWQFTGGRPITNKCKTEKDIQAKSKESNLMSEDLKKRGFKFVGSTICYAFMQAAGLVNDHLTSCFRYKEVK